MGRSSGKGVAAVERQRRRVRTGSGSGSPGFGVAGKCDLTRSPNLRGNCGHRDQLRWTKEWRHHDGRKSGRPAAVHSRRSRGRRDPAGGNRPDFGTSYGDDSRSVRSDQLARGARTFRGSFPLDQRTKVDDRPYVGRRRGDRVGCLAFADQRGFVHPSLNCEDLHPQLDWCDGKIPRKCLRREVNVVAKSAFGFGDVNTTIIFQRYDPDRERN